MVKNGKKIEKKAKKRQKQIKINCAIQT